MWNQYMGQDIPNRCNNSLVLLSVLLSQVECTSYPCSYADFRFSAFLSNVTYILFSPFPTTCYFNTNDGLRTGDAPWLCRRQRVCCRWKGRMPLNGKQPTGRAQLSTNIRPINRNPSPAVWVPLPSLGTKSVNNPFRSGALLTIAGLWFALVTGAAVSCVF